MPYVFCPACGARHHQSRDLIGLTADCPACGASFRVTEDGTEDEPVIRRRKKKTMLPVLVAGGLMLTSVVLIFLVASRAGKPAAVAAKNSAEQKPAAKKAATARPAATPAREDVHADTADADAPNALERAAGWAISTAVGVIALVVLAAIYVIPTVIAIYRGHTNTGPIVVVNLLLGWLFIGWVVALAWSLTGRDAVPDRDRPR